MFDTTINKNERADETTNLNSHEDAKQAEHQRKLSEVRAKITFTSTGQIPNFDELAFLAEHAPEEFENVRQRLCERAINSSPSHLRKRLSGLQFVIDMERQRAKNPMEACIRISGLMHDSLAELCRAFENPEAYTKEKESHSAKVIPLF